MEKAYSDFASYTQENLDAFMKANAAMTKGVELITKNLFALASHTLEEVTSAGKRFAAVKSMGEAFELQSRYAQESMETLVTEVRKAQDLSATVAKDTVAPLAERFKATVSTLTAAGFPLSTPSPSKKAA